MSDEQAEIQQVAREFLDEYPHHLRIRDGEHKLAIAQFAAAFHISQSSEERKRIQELERELLDAKQAANHKIIYEMNSNLQMGKKRELEAEVSRLRGALERLRTRCHASIPGGGMQHFNVQAAVEEIQAALSSPPASTEREVKG